MPIVNELRISITAKDYSRLFKDTEYIKEKKLKYNYNYSSYEDNLPAKFLEIVRCKNSTYSYSKDRELWEDYCTWCDIVLNRSNIPVVIKGDY